MKRNQCLFCSSRKCYERVYRTGEPRYDEIACRKHVADLHAHADGKLGKNNGVMRTYSTSTGPQWRGKDAEVTS